MWVKLRCFIDLCNRWRGAAAILFALFERPYLSRVENDYITQSWLFWEHFCSNHIMCLWKLKINWKKLFIKSFGDLLITVLPFSLSSCNNRLSFHHLFQLVKVFSRWQRISICSWYSYIYMPRSSWVKWVALLLLLLLPISGMCDSLRSLHCYLSQTLKQLANWLFPGFCCLVVPSCLLSELYSLP